MSGMPPNYDEFDDADERYRRASARDAGRPSEAVRRAVQAQAERLAAERRSRVPMQGQLTFAHRRRQWWRPAVFGTLAAAMMAGLILLPPWVTRQAPEAPAPVEVELAANVGRSLTAPVPVQQELPAASAPQAALRVAPKTAPAGSSRVERVSPPAEVARLVLPTPGTAGSLSGGLGAQAARAAPAPAATAASADAQASAHTEAFEAIVVSGSRVTRASAMAPAAAAPSDPAADLRKAAARGDLAALEHLAGQADVNARDAEGRTALLLAAQGGQANAVAALLAYGADPNIADAQGETPLKAAQAIKATAMVATLQRYGARQ
jgi:hypothetical protein